MVNINSDMSFLDDEIVNVIVMVNINSDMSCLKIPYYIYINGIVMGQFHRSPEACSPEAWKHGECITGNDPLLRPQDSG
jgi:hypothetical protein